ncbi:TonB family protein [Sterolibacterium denitrificans]|nr:TonB family protein [Sterolibacterium denitrificans]
MISAIQHSHPGRKAGTKPLTVVALMAALLATLTMMTPAPAHAQNARKAISREAPAFPSDALDDGVDSGSVKARLSVAADGSVTNVDILEANPKGYFEKAVKRALVRWKYEPGAAETIDALVTFKDR